MDYICEIILILLGYSLVIKIGSYVHSLMEQRRKNQIWHIRRRWTTDCLGKNGKPIQVGVIVVGEINAQGKRRPRIFNEPPGYPGNLAGAWQEACLWATETEEETFDPNPKQGNPNGLRLIKTQ